MPSALLLDPAETVVGGSLVLAAVFAFAAGVVSFASPCVLPLVPAYLSYVTGMVGIDLGEAKRGRLLLGTALFIGGFTVVFVSYGALFGGLGSVLIEYTDVITRVLGVFTIVFGLAFMGLIPWLNRSWNPTQNTSMGLVGAPLLGVLFGIGCPASDPRSLLCRRWPSTQRAPDEVPLSPLCTASGWACRSC
jgi:cytochrome c-type biogenesis protein